jgi:hypothetical protein
MQYEVRAQSRRCAISRPRSWESGATTKQNQGIARSRRASATRLGRSRPAWPIRLSPRCRIGPETPPSISAGSARDRSVALLLISLSRAFGSLRASARHSARD